MTLGSGCIVVPNVHIGRGAFVGAGALVTRDVAPGTMMAGIAARPTLRSTTDPER